MKDYAPWPTSSQGPAVDAILDDVVGAVDPRQWHRLLDATVEAIRRALPMPPAHGRCVCGWRLFDPSGRVRVSHSHELDYGYNFQAQSATTTDGQTRFTCSPRSYETTTVADLMCVSCERLYRLPAGARKDYD